MKVLPNTVATSVVASVHLNNTHHQNFVTLKIKPIIRNFDGSHSKKGPTSCLEQ